jgi:hypothetical protein
MNLAKVKTYGLGPEQMNMITSGVNNNAVSSNYY